MNINPYLPYVFCNVVKTLIKVWAEVKSGELMTVRDRHKKWGANIITGELILKIRVKHLMLGTNIKKWVPLSGLLKPKFLDMSMQDLWSFNHHRSVH